MEIIGGIVAVLILLALALAAFKPNTFLVQRSATINVPPSKVFSYIDDFHNWGSWSPFETRDLNMQKTFGGAAHGKGAIYEWTGNNKAGSGRMEITDSMAPHKVIIKIDFIKPFEAHNIIEFAFTALGHNTEVTWSMRGQIGFGQKIVQLFINMDKVVGKEFDEGLANLKAVSESRDR